MNRRLRGAGLVGIVLLLLLALIIGCGEKQTAPTSPQPSAKAEEWTLDNPLFKPAIAVQEQNTPYLMKNAEVVGTAVTLTEDGQPAILVLVKTGALQRGPGGIPLTLENLPVIVEVTGEIRPMKTTTPTIDHKAKQTPPIQLGTSGGWRYDLANGYCCGGTLGSMIQKGGSKYILSNYHVLEADIVSGGNNRVATTGDPVVQPGLIDIGCVASNGQDVATLEVYHSLPNNNVDAAIAKIITGMVDANGAILEIGTLSASTVAAAVNQAVKKSGRTTGLTRSKVSGLNATVSVAYDNECAGSAAFTKTFTGQIIITNRASKFLNSGDSGSLMVEDISTNPRAVGLLFAGGSSTAVANPIDQVLSFFGATMVGN